MTEAEIALNPEGPLHDRNSFANALLWDWDNAMDIFFEKVVRKMREHDLTKEQVRAALDRGYGYEVGDQWDEWMEEFDA